MEGGWGGAAWSVGDADTELLRCFALRWLRGRGEGNGKGWGLMGELVRGWNGSVDGTWS